jgi:hypothetical protein
MQRAIMYIGNKCFDAPAHDATDMAPPGHFVISRGRHWSFKSLRRLR